MSLLEDATGAAAGIAAVVHDETAPWAEEQELHREVRETAQVREGGR